MKLSSVLVLLGCAAAVTLFVAHADDAKSAKKPAAKPVAKMQLPRVESADLNGDPFVLPDDFTAPRTLLLLAFEQRHQYPIDGWVKGLKLEESDKDWFELPTVGAMNSRRRESLDNAMREGIPGRDMRSRIVTLYTNDKDFLAPMGLTKTDTIYAVVVDKNGAVLAIEKGKFDKAKAAKIAKVWRMKK